jgi:hypothetical protein
VPGILTVLIINALLYGAPLTTGYGSLFELYAFESLFVNIRNYTGWLIETQTPLILLAIVPLVVRDALRRTHDGVSPRACLGALAGLTLLSYLFYATFNHWFYLRFLLPAYAAAFVLLAAAIRWGVSKLPAEVRVPAAALVCAVMIPFGIDVAKDGVFNVATYEGRHVRAANEIASRAPANAVVLSVQHSGSVRYYANRITLRYDWLADDALDLTLRDLAARGRPVYLVVDDWEEKEFRERFAPANQTAQLPEPIARVSGSPEVRIFELQGGGPAPTQ